MNAVEASAEYSKLWDDLVGEMPSDISQQVKQAMSVLVAQLGEHQMGDDHIGWVASTIALVFQSFIPPMVRLTIHAVPDDLFEDLQIEGGT